MISTRENTCIPYSCNFTHCGVRQLGGAQRQQLGSRLLLESPLYKYHVAGMNELTSAFPLLLYVDEVNNELQTNADVAELAPTSHRPKNIGNYIFCGAIKKKFALSNKYRDSSFRS